MQDPVKRPARLTPPISYATVAGDAPLGNSCVAALVAISGADWTDVLPAALDAKAKVRGKGAAESAADIADLSLLEMDYAFTNLGYFLSRVGDYRQRSLTLADWASRPRPAGIFYAVETHAATADRACDGEVVAVLGDSCVYGPAAEPVPIAQALLADAFAGQVFTVTSMADARWSA